MNIFNKDLSKAGAADGEKDAEDGKPNSHYGVLKQPKTWVFGSESVSSYSQAYNRMYTKEQEHQANVYAPADRPINKTASQSRQGAAMSNATSFAHQIELLQQLKTYLEQFQEKLLVQSSNYQRKVDALHADGGLMDETYKDFVENQLTTTQEKINQLVEHIAGNNIPAVEKEISFLENR